MTTFEISLKTALDRMIEADDQYKPVMVEDLIQALATNYLDSEVIENMAVDFVSLAKVKKETEDEQAEQAQDDDRDYEQSVFPHSII